MKKFSSVSFFNKNNVNIEDISEYQLAKSNLIVCLDPNEIRQDKDYIYSFLNKANDYLLVEMVDLPITTSEFKSKYNKKTFEEVNQAMGYNCNYDILPNKEQIEKIYNFILKHNSESFIVSCSAGVSRSGALAHFLTYLGFDMVETSNNKFLPNPLILNELLLLVEKPLFYNVSAEIISENEKELIIKIEENYYSYRKYLEDGFTSYMGRSLNNNNHFKKPLLINDIYLFGGSGLKMINKSKL